MLAYCSWEELEADCNDLFETEATDDGYCCSFNSIVLKKTKNQTNLVKRYVEQTTEQSTTHCNVYVGSNSAMIKSGDTSHYTHAQYII